MFTIPLNHYHIPDWAKWKAEILTAVDSSIFESQDNGPDTDFYYYNRTQSKPKYYSIVTSAISEILADIEKDYPIPVHIKQMWMQSAKQGQWHHPHNHGSVGLSAVLYLEFDPKTHQGTTFFAPYHNFITGDHIQYTPEVSEGDLLIFPSAIMHMQAPHNSSSVRQVISFNIAAP